MNQIRRQCRHQRLALSRSHFRYLALVKNIAADKLNIEMSHLHISLCSLADHRKSFRQYIFRIGPRRNDLSELTRFGFKLLIGELRNSRFKFTGLCRNQ